MMVFCTTSLHDQQVIVLLLIWTPTCFVMYGLIHIGDPKNSKVKDLLMFIHSILFGEISVDWNIIIISKPDQLLKYTQRVHRVLFNTLQLFILGFNDRADIWLTTVTVTDEWLYTQPDVMLGLHLLPTAPLQTPVRGRRKHLYSLSREKSKHLRPDYMLLMKRDLQIKRKYVEISCWKQGDKSLHIHVIAVCVYSAILVTCQGLLQNYESPGFLYLYIKLSSRFKHNFEQGT